MNLRLKVILATSLAVLLSLGVLGNFALSTYRSITLESLNARLSDTVREINDTDDSPLQVAFYLSTVATFPLLVGVADSNGRVTNLSELPLQVKRISMSDLERAQRSAIEDTDAELLLRSVALPDSAHIILATDLSEINETLVALQRNIILTAVALIFSNAIFIHLVTRRDFARMRRLVGQSNVISAGDYKAEITSVPGTNEVAQLSQSIAAMTKTLQENAENLQVLFGSISHELKTPLTAIRGYVELLASTSELTTSQEHSLDIIATEVERMTLLINDLLLLSKLGTLTYELNDTFDVVTVIRERTQVIRDLQPERTITISGDSLFITACQGLIERLIDNLIANLLNHTSPTTEVSFDIAGDAHSWTLRYRDAGPGLPKTYGSGLTVAFEKFDPRKTLSTSTGLGLFIIQSIVEQHHGTIEVEPGPGLGLIFRFPHEKRYLSHFADEV